MIQLMKSFGFDRFCVAGHDRGARVAYRLGLDHPQHVEKIAILDVVPTIEAFDRADARFALAFWPWSLLAQPEPLPEQLICGNPRAVIEHALSAWGSSLASFPAQVQAAYVDALRDPNNVHAICEEYRAAATIDVEMERADREAGRRIACPLLVLWAKGSGLDTWYEADGGPLAIWRGWAADVEGRAMSGGHFFAEENAAEIAEEMQRFFSRS